MEKKASKKSTRPVIEIAKTAEEKQKALDKTLAEIEKAFGKGAVMRLGENAANKNTPVIPSGSISLDIALGVGGLPRGRIIEVYGPESSGKTTVALHLVAETQKLGGVCGYIDAEHAMDPVYAKKLGVNIDELYISQPDDGEQALEITETMVRSGVIELVVVDSVAALTPRAEIDGNMGDSHMALQARLMSQALRKITAFANRTSCTVLFINQLRANIGGMGGAPKETTTGGRALKFYASVRLDIRRVEGVKQGEDFIGNRTKVKVAKNKVAPPFKVCHFDIMYGEGISREGDVLDLAVELDIVKKSGAWYSLGDERLGQGRENVKTYLKEHPKVYDELAAAIRNHYGLPDVKSLEFNPPPTAEEPPKKTVKGKAKKKEDPALEPEALSDDDILMEELIFDDDE